MRDIQISDHFDYSTMLLFSLPTIGTLIVNSTYVVADVFLASPADTRFRRGRAVEAMEKKEP